MAADPEHLLRPGLLEGTNVAIAAAPGPPPGSTAAAVSAGAAALGAVVSQVPLAPAGDAERDEAAARSALAAVSHDLGGDLHALVVDSASLFAPGGGREAIACAAATWNAVRAAAELALLRESGGGKIVLLAPDHAASAAGLENLARTLSIEWARHEVRCVAIAPGAATTGGELATLVCYLLSPAGDYFSGCLMDLRGGRARGRSPASS